MHIEHINITAPMRLLIETRDFYCTVFDLVVGYRPNFGSNGYWLYADDKAIIHLTECDSKTAFAKESHFDHFAIQMKGLEQVKSSLKKLHVEYSVDHLVDIGMTQLFFTDPAGVGVEANFLEE